VVAVACDEQGNIDRADLAAKGGNPPPEIRKPPRR